MSRTRVARARRRHHRRRWVFDHARAERWFARACRVWPEP